MIFFLLHRPEELLPVPTQNFMQPFASTSLRVHPTFDGGVGWWSLHAQVPRWVSLVGKVPHLQVADGEPDDRGFVQLAGDGARQRQHFGQLVKFKVLLSPPWPRCIPRLLLPQSLQPGRRAKNDRMRNPQSTTLRTEKITAPTNPVHVWNVVLAN